jgi:endonuclease/exonuclease/phosphatase family metal-dependent hydrolase
MVFAAVGLFVGLPFIAVVLLYAELRLTSKQYALLSSPLSARKLPSEGPLALRTVFLNTHLLPIRIESIAGNRPDGLYRARRIADKFADYDIVGLCEAFDPTCLESLIHSLQERSGNAFSVVSSPLPSSGCFLGGGCVLLSRYPIESVEAIRYSNSSTIWNHGIWADGFAEKGAILARIRLDSRMNTESSLACVVTHLEARSPDCRAKQISELADALRHWSHGNPLVVMGDLNTVAQDGQAYTSLTNALTTEGGQLHDAWEEVGASQGGTSEPMSKDGGDRIDYIFYEPGRGNHRIHLTDVSVLQLHDELVGSLSDHAAVECAFSFQ